MFRNEADDDVGALTILWRLWLLAFAWIRFFGWRLATVLLETLHPARLRTIATPRKRRRPGMKKADV